MISYKPFEESRPIDDSWNGFKPVKTGHIPSKEG